MKDKLDSIVLVRVLDRLTAEDEDYDENDFQGGESLQEVSFQ
jgi:hypothetical protein